MANRSDNVPLPEGGGSLTPPNRHSQNKAAQSLTGKGSHRPASTPANNPTPGVQPERSSHHGIPSGSAAHGKSVPVPAPTSIRSSANPPGSPSPASAPPPPESTGQVPAGKRPQPQQKSASPSQYAAHVDQNIVQPQLPLPQRSTMPPEPHSIAIVFQIGPLAKLFRKQQTAIQFPQVAPMEPLQPRPVPGRNVVLDQASAQAVSQVRPQPDRPQSQIEQHSVSQPVLSVQQEPEEQEQAPQMALPAPVRSSQEQPLDAPTGGKMRILLGLKWTSRILIGVTIVGLMAFALLNQFTWLPLYLDDRQIAAIWPFLAFINAFLLFIILLTDILILEQHDTEQQRLHNELDQMRHRERQLQADLAALHEAPVPSAQPQAAQAEEPMKAPAKIEIPLARSTGLNARPAPTGPLPDENLRPQPEPRSIEMARQPVDPPDYDPKARPYEAHEKYYPTNGSSSHLGFGWHIIGASRRGYGHYNGKYREDDFAVRIFPLPQSNTCRPALAAIADGMGSKTYSRIGAHAAVEGATQTKDIEQDIAKLVRYFRREYLDIHSPAWNEDVAAVAWQILSNAIRSAQLRVLACAEEYKISQDDLHSTLMLFLAFPLSKQHLFVAAHQIGDGVLFKMQAGERWNWLLGAQIQAAGNEVQPLLKSDEDTWKSFFRWEILDNGACVMGVTDGIADDIEPPRDPQANPFEPVNTFYRKRVLPVFAASEPARQLVEAIGYHQRQSFDDRTLICIYRENQ